MKIITSVADMAGTCLQSRHSGKTIGFVPTMGFLHEGHRSLIRLARSRVDIVVVSIFVNPTQFGPGEDFDRYPRDMVRDTGLCAGEGVDILFCPEVRDMYAEGCSVSVEEGHISHSLCGLSRPGHFSGVLTVVAKLLNIVRPDVAVFGQKDAQQCRLVQQMIHDLNFQVELIAGPTVREADGLAMSSRNVYLSEEARRDAVCVPLALGLARQLYEAGTRDALDIKDRMKTLIGKYSLARIDYVEILDRARWKPVETLEGPGLVAIAVKVGSVRLIDNITIGAAVVPPESLPQPLRQ
ncbi:MAG: pantoate--beta-alanine ligase [bacterium]